MSTLLLATQLVERVKQQFNNSLLFLLNIILLHKSIFNLVCSRMKEEDMFWMLCSILCDWLVPEVRCAFEAILATYRMILKWCVQCASMTPLMWLSYAELTCGQKHMFWIDIYIYSFVIKVIRSRSHFVCSKNVFLASIYIYSRVFIYAKTKILLQFWFSFEISSVINIEQIK